MVGSLAFGIYLDEFAASANKGSLIGLHKSVGVIVLLLALVRLINIALNKRRLATKYRQRDPYFVAGRHNVYANIRRDDVGGYPVGDSACH